MAPTNRDMVCRIYRQPFIAHLRPSQLLCHLKILKDKKLEICKCERQNRRAAAEKFLSHFKECPDVNYFEDLVDAMEMADMPILHELLTKRSKISKIDAFDQIMEFLYDDLMQLNIKELIKNLLQNDSLAVQDEEEILKAFADGEDEGSLALLMLRVATYDGEWVDPFRNAVHEQDPDLARKIDMAISGSLPQEMDVAKDSECSFTLSHHEDSSLKASIDSTGMKELASSSVPRNEESNKRMDCEFSSPHELQDTTGLKRRCTSAEASDSDHPAKLMKLGTGQGAASDDDETESKQAKDVDVDKDEKSEGVVGTKKEGISLMNFQRELMEPALSGQNVVITSPTGTGKTCVAAEIIKHHFESVMDRECKAVFCVPTNALITQQRRALAKQLPKSIRMRQISGDKASISIAEMLSECDVLITMPQIVLNDGEDMDISRFSLIVFDECHHCHKGHPYNNIMTFYHLAKREDPYAALPQIVGMSASLGVGLSSTESDCVDCIMELLANLDCQKLSAVTQYAEELQQFENKPLEINKRLRDRDSDPFLDKVKSLMKAIEEVLDPGLQDPDEIIGSPPVVWSKKLYHSWLQRLTNTVKKLDDGEQKRHLNACYSHLKAYNSALVINSDGTMKYALKHLKKEMQEIEFHMTKIGYNIVPIERELYKLYTEALPELESYCEISHIENPKLEELAESILLKKKPSEPMRCIVFCQTRELCAAVVDWMKEETKYNLRALKPHHFTGTSASADEKGMTGEQQDWLIKAFADGHHQVLVATQAAEEGLDIKPCNSVIRYRYTKGVTSGIQSRGRAREDDAVVQILADEDEEGREEDNRIREKMQNAAIKTIKEMSPEEFRNRVHQIQSGTEFEDRFKEEMRNRRLRKERQQLRDEGNDYMLHCVYCDEFAVCSDAIKVINGSHHVVIDQKFRSKTKIDRTSDKKSWRGGWERTGIIRCKKCSREWGRQSTFADHEHYVLKIDRFEVVTPLNERERYKKWKECPFYMETFRPDIHLPKDD